MSRRIVIIEEDEEDVIVPNINRRINPINESWICPYCGKRVYSMEYHPCNQPYC